MEVPGFFMGGGYFGSGAGDLSPEKRLGEQKSLEHFTVDELLDFPNEDALMADGFLNNVANSTDSSAITPVDSCNSSVSGGDNHFPGNMTHFASELCVPYEDMAELEWLSNFVEDSFSTEEDFRSLHLVTGTKPPTSDSSCSDNRPDSSTRTTNFPTETPLPVKARSKRSRAAPCDWSTRLLHLASDPKPPLDKAANHTTPTRKRDVSGANSDSSGRKCLHCATEKTPQWRTGPMGPKTLCNACGVRYKSGRLVAEYRPAASPTFMSTRHSNSHRKVLELRRQKEMQRAQQHQQFLSQSSIFGVSNGSDEYLIHHHNGPDYRHMI